jgi:peroxiredoxin
MHPYIARLRWGLLLLCIALPHSALCVDAGAPAPALVVQQTDGHMFDLAAFKGHVVVLHYCASWCGPCRLEMPVLEALYRRYHGRGLEMLAVSVDSTHARDDFGDMMKPYHFPAAMLRDADKDGFGAPDAIPVTYIIDKKGIIRNVFLPDNSTLTATQLSDAVQPLL